MQHGRVHGLGGTRAVSKSNASSYSYRHAVRRILTIRTSSEHANVDDQLMRWHCNPERNRRSAIAIEACPTSFATQRMTLSPFPTSPGPAALFGDDSASCILHRIVRRTFTAREGCFLFLYIWTRRVANCVRIHRPPSGLVNSHTAADDATSSTGLEVTRPSCNACNTLLPARMPAQRCGARTLPCTARLKAVS